MPEKTDLCRNYSVMCWNYSGTTRVTEKFQVVTEKAILREEKGGNANTKTAKHTAKKKANSPITNRPAGQQQSSGPAGEQRRSCRRMHKGTGRKRRKCKHENCKTHIKKKSKLTNHQQAGRPAAEQRSSRRAAAVLQKDA
eukprot:GHVU01077914.1.p1 GENE.GHVU01077914.1~~GHVU01077914.1.p1  ORF type:complete len:140 (-),score=24.60 GHVU01077914.1:31-450(-)